jgi:hypothetical protein
VGGLGQRLAEAIRGSSDMSRTAQQPGPTGEWPVVPPVPTPTPPPPAPTGPEPPIINQVSLIAPAVPAGAPADRFAPPTSAIPVPPAPTRQWRVPLISRGGGPAIALRTRPVRRAMAVPSRADEVWQSRYAMVSAGIVAVPFTLVAIPFLIALYQAALSPDAAVADLVPLGLILLGVFLAAITTWVVVVEMRARVRLVDALGRTGEHEAPGSSGSFGPPRPFVQVPTQLGLLAVALTAFIGATVLIL